MRVVEIFGEPINKGGQQSFVLYTLRNMDLTNMEVDLFSPYYADNKDLINLVEDNHGTVFAGGLTHEPGKSRRNTIPVLRSFLNSHHYDVAHIHSGSITALAYSAREAARAGIKKIIVHSHSPGVSENLKHRLVRMYAAPIMKKYVTDYCACSKDAAKWKFPQSVIPQVKIIRNGVDTAHFAFDPQIRRQMRERYSIDDDTLVLGHVGRFSTEKNQAFLLDVLKYYLDCKPKEKIKLFLLGEGEEKEKVLQKAKTLGLTDLIICPDEYDKVREYLQLYDVFVFPSLYEGLPLVALEAQTSGLPIVASTGVPEIINITGRVRFASLNDPDAWCKAIDELRILQRKDSGAVIRKAGFDIRYTAKEVEKLYINQRETEYRR